MHLFALLLVIHYASGTHVTEESRCLASKLEGLDASGRRDSSHALQAGLDACANGGTFVLDIPGVFLSASLIAHGSIDIAVPSYATLKARSERSAYGHQQPSWYLLSFQNCSHCSLSGGGTLDGSGREYVVGTRPDRKLVRNWVDASCPRPTECRPRLLGVVNSHHVSLKDIRFRDPIYWTVRVFQSRHIALDSLEIRGDWEIANTDGIDIDGSSDVAIKNSLIDTADDGICLKTTVRGHPAHHIDVHNCTVRSRSAAFKIGSETREDIHDVAVRDLQILDSHRGLAVQLRDEGDISRITFSRVNLTTVQDQFGSWWGGGEPLYITAVPRARSTRVGSIANVSFDAISAWSEAGCFISGDIRGLNVRQSSFTLQQLTPWAWPGLDYRPSYRGLVLGGHSHGVLAESGAHVHLQDVVVSYTQPFRLDWGKPLEVRTHAAVRSENVSIRGWHQQSIAVS